MQTSRLESLLPHAYRFDRFELRPLERTALADGQVLAIGARALDVLLALVERGGQLVSKEELLQCVWPGLVVEEGNIHVQVSQLRKVFGASAIATVAGLGYRFALRIERVGDTPPHNLPAARTPFIGRLSALAEAEERLQGTRLLTFIGIGGSGKTRLALRLAERLLPQFADGMWFVDLAPLESAAQVPIAVARALSVAQGADTPLEQGLVDKLRERRTLLFFDNCEHLLDAVESLAGVLLGGAPQLKILCTSREALGLAGETTFAVRPLELPAANADAAGITAAESVQLFIERARAAAPGLAFDAQGVSVVAEICRRLDGIPLAIELAAARMKMLSVTQVRSLLDERFRLLSGGMRALPRQQTLQAVIQWSWEQLGAPEQGLLCALSVCGGGCDLAAAAALLGDARDDMAVLDSLARLVDKSLLTVERHTPMARYVMLETVRQFALDRLGASGETAMVRDRHRDHFLARAEEMDRQLMGDAPGTWIARLDAERDNLFRALAWCDGSEGAQRGLRMVVALRDYWPSRGMLVRGYEVTLEALARPSAQRRELWRCRALSALAQLCFLMGRDQEACGHAEASLLIARKIGDDRRIAISLSQIGQSRVVLGELAAARQSFEEALVLARRTGNESEVGDALRGLARLHREAGEYEAAETLYEEVLFLRRRLNQPFGEALAIGNLSSMAINRRMPERATARLIEAWDLVGRTESRYVSQNFLDLAAALAALTGESEMAIRLYAASAEQRSEIGMPLIPLGPEQASDLARAREALGEAACAAAEQAGRAMDYEQATAEVGEWLKRSEGCSSMSRHT